MPNHFSSYKPLFKIASKGRVLLAFLPMGLMATGLPSGWDVKVGTATVTQTTTETTINQTTKGAAINWNDFSVPSGHTVTFNTPVWDGYTMNSVVGAAKSVIAGKVRSNSTFILANPNGILVEESGDIKSDFTLLSGNRRYYSTGSEKDDKYGDFGTSQFMVFREFGHKKDGTWEPPLANSVVNYGSIDGRRGVRLAGAEVEHLGGDLVSKDGSIQLNVGAVTPISIAEYIFPHTGPLEWASLYNDQRVYKLRMGEGATIRANVVLMTNFDRKETNNNWAPISYNKLTDTQKQTPYGAPFEKFDTKISGNIIITERSNMFSSFQQRDYLNAINNGSVGLDNNFGADYKKTGRGLNIMVETGVIDNLDVKFISAEDGALRIFKPGLERARPFWQPKSVYDHIHTNTYLHVGSNVRVSGGQTIEIFSPSIFFKDTTETPSEILNETNLAVLASNSYVPSQITVERLKRLKDEVERIKSITLSKSSKGKERIVGAHQSVMDETPIRIR